MNSLGDLSIPFGYRQSRPVSIIDSFKIENHAIKNNPESQIFSNQKSPQNTRYTKETIPDEGSVRKGITVSSKSGTNGLEKKDSIEQETTLDSYGIENNNPIFGKTSSLLPMRTKANMYNSYHKFNPGQFEENSAEWQMAMLQYLLDMKNNGHNVQEVSFDKVRFNNSINFISLS